MEQKRQKTSEDSNVDHQAKTIDRLEREMAEIKARQQVLQQTMHVAQLRTKFEDQVRQERLAGKEFKLRCNDQEEVEIIRQMVAEKSNIEFVRTEQDACCSSPDCFGHLDDCISFYTNLKWTVHLKLHFN